MVKDTQSPLAMLRTLRFMTQNDLAEAIGVSETTIRNWEKGRATPQLTPKQTKALCNALHITLEQLPDNFDPQHVSFDTPVLE
jgi:DNA-binding XRE family transcriptional regulator